MNITSHLDATITCSTHSTHHMQPHVIVSKHKSLTLSDFVMIVLPFLLTGHPNCTHVYIHTVTDKQTCICTHPRNAIWFLETQSPRQSSSASTLLEVWDKEWVEKE